MKFRGTLTLALLAFVLVMSDLLQRTVIAPLVRLVPRRRHRILAWWQQRMAGAVLVPVRLIGGARTGDIPKIPDRPGVLVLMNHQSLLDIPLVVSALHPGYPRIVTRERYASGKPLISHMVRLYQYPTVNPRATVRADLEALETAARECPVPLVIYPEGTRTRDGTVGRFKRTGLRTILPARDWEVWMMTVDGYWECARLKDFRASVSTIRGRIRLDGPFPGPGAGADPDRVDAFIDETQERMRGFLAELRSGGES